MSRINEEYKIDTNPRAKKDVIVRGDNYRFTILTTRLLRLEYSEDGIFEDRATKTVVCRDFPETQFRVIDENDRLEIVTEHLHLTYDKKVFSRNGLSIKLKGNLTAYGSEWFFGQEIKDLKGTARTLDEADGPVTLGNGILSRSGFSIIDDSSTITLAENGWVEPTRKNRTDIYFLGYGRDYLACLKDFFRLSGATPMLPRYALGNWWSRFHRYTETEYKELMENFAKEKVPFSVAVIDMDWHLTKIPSKYGSGWTGYTWNRSFFPDPQGFLGWLHEKGLHVSLNVHPADGVRAHEEMYREMAKAMGVDYKNEDPIPFDASNPEFLFNYFKYLHHPNEEMGVDFWWIDWQQNGGTRCEGYDPDFILNHYHYLDNARNGKRPLVFSRYAGVGSHRYPIGFSGDTFATWESLDFQPYFTATASNIGYGWWSHDIGGHMHGIKNDEMAARWLQFGVFSPIMRIHSSDNPFNCKELWNYNAIVEKTMKSFLRLRHKLVPYLYTMNYHFHKEGEPLVQPMYYRNSEEEQAYHVPNEYYFGSSLIVCPITSPMDSKLQMGCFKAWLPEGVYFDIFSGRVYKGGRKIDLYRDISSIPVLAKAGGIIPLVGEASINNSTENPGSMEIYVFSGEDGAFELYEDNDGVESKGTLKSGLTKMQFHSSKCSTFKIGAYIGDEGVVPKERSYLLRFFGVQDTAEVTVTSDGNPVAFDKSYDEKLKCLVLSTPALPSDREVSFAFNTDGIIAGNDVMMEVFELLNHAQIEFDLKDTIYRIIQKQSDKSIKLGELMTLNLNENLLGALYEILTAW